MSLECPCIYRMYAHNHVVLGIPLSLQNAHHNNVCFQNARRTVHCVTMKQHAMNVLRAST